MIKAVLFDYGGVMTTGGVGTDLTDRLGANLGISGTKAYELLGPLWAPYSKGELTTDEVWQKIEAAHGQTVDPSKRAVWNVWEHMQPLSEMVQLVAKLKNEGLTVGLLSNVMPETAADIHKNHGYDLFDFAVLSCEIGLAKPEPAMYEYAMRKLPGIKPEEVVFIDDQQRCLDPAAAMGMRTILAAGPDSISQQLEKLRSKN